MKKNALIINILILLFFIVLISCGTTAQSTVTPDWVNNYPANDEFYIGIGSSNVASESEARDLARAQAFTYLAAQISSNIQSEQSSMISSDSKGGNYEASELKIKESVNQNLKEVEIVDEYYSKSGGYWFYARLNKAKWAMIQEKEITDLKDRVTKLVNPVLNDKSKTSSAKLAVLGKGWELVEASPYSGMINADLAGESGSLIDILEKKIRFYIEDFSISIDPSQINTQPGKSETVNVSVKSKSGTNPGVLNIIIIKKSDKTELTNITTEKDGTFKGQINFSTLPLGKNELLAKLDIASFGVNEDSLNTKLSIVQKDFIANMEQINVNLIVKNTDTSNNIDSLYDSVKAIFSQNLPFKISEEENNNSRFNIVFNIYFRNMPDNGLGLYITKAKASISLQKGQQSLFDYNTPEYKGGGLDFNQAQNRAAIELFRELEKNPEFLANMTKAFSYD